MSDNLPATADLSNDVLCDNCGHRLGEHIVAYPHMYRCPDPPRYFRAPPSCICRPAEVTERSAAVFATDPNCPLHGPLRFQL